MKDSISTKEITETRQIIGRLNWLTTQTKSDLCNNVCALSPILKQENIECIKQAKSVGKKAKDENS